MEDDATRSAGGADDAKRIRAGTLAQTGSDPPAQTAERLADLSSRVNELAASVKQYGSRLDDVYHEQKRSREEVGALLGDIGRAALTGRLGRPGPTPTPPVEHLAAVAPGWIMGAIVPVFLAAYVTVLVLEGDRADGRMLLASVAVLAGLVGLAFLLWLLRGEGRHV